MQKMWLRHLAATTACAMVLLLQPASAGAGETGAPVYQLRVYGLVDTTKTAFHARFRDRAMPIMKRHGFDIVAIWETRDSSGPAFVYLLRWPDEATLKKSWAAFLADPEWIRIKAQTPAEDRPIMRDVEQDRVLRLTDYSPNRP